MTNLGKKKALCYGYGVFEVFIAQALAQDFNEVFVFTPYWSAFPNPIMDMVGEGVPGVTRAESYEDAKEQVKSSGGLFVFCDVGDGPKQAELRMEAKRYNEEFRVFGTGDAQELEIYRRRFKKALKEVGLPVPRYDVIRGIDNLFLFLQDPKNDNVYLKIDGDYRGLLETYHHIDWEHSATRMFKFAMDLGILRDIVKVVVEWPIEGVECGSDHFISGGALLDHGLFGWELKDSAYVCKVMETSAMPQAVRAVNDAMAPIHKRYNTCGAISTEVRIGDDKKPYFNDACMRFGNPPAAIISSIYKNLGNVMWGVAGGEVITPEYNAQYGAEISVDSQVSTCELIPMDMKDSDWKCMKVVRSCKVGGQYYCIPHPDFTTVIKAVGIGKTRQEAQDMALDAAERFQCPGKAYDRSCFDDIDSTIADGVKYGVDKI